MNWKHINTIIFISIVLILGMLISGIWLVTSQSGALWILEKTLKQDQQLTLNTVSGSFVKGLEIESVHFVPEQLNGLDDDLPEYSINKVAISFHSNCWLLQRCIIDIAAKQGQYSEDTHQIHFDQIHLQADLLPWKQLRLNTEIQLLEFTGFTDYEGDADIALPIKIPGIPKIPKMTFLPELAPIISFESVSVDHVIINDIPLTIEAFKFSGHLSHNEIELKEMSLSIDDNHIFADGHWVQNARQAITVKVRIESGEKRGNTELTLQGKEENWTLNASNDVYKSNILLQWQPKSSKQIRVEFDPGRMVEMFDISPLVSAIPLDNIELNLANEEDGITWWLQSKRESLELSSEGLISNEQVEITRATLSSFKDNIRKTQAVMSGVIPLTNQSSGHISIQATHWNLPENATGIKNWSSGQLHLFGTGKDWRQLSVKFDQLILEGLPRSITMNGGIKQHELPGWQFDELMVLQTQSRNRIIVNGDTDQIRATVELLEPQLLNSRYSGTLKGSFLIENNGINGVFMAQDFHFPGSSVNDLTLSIKGNTSDFSIQVDAKAVKINQYQWPVVNLSVQGGQNSHQILLQADGDIPLNLTLTGELDTNTYGWQGIVEKADTILLGEHWKLKNSFPVTIEPRLYSGRIEPGCWVTRKQELCINELSYNNSIKASIDVIGLDIAKFNIFLPKGFNASGGIRGSIAYEESPESPNGLTFDFVQNSTLWLSSKYMSSDWSDAKLSGVIGSDITLDLALSNNDNKLSARLFSSDLPEKQVRFRVEVTDVTLDKLLIPLGDTLLDGQISGDLTGVLEDNGSLFPNTLEGSLLWTPLSSTRSDEDGMYSIKRIDVHAHNQQLVVDSLISLNGQQIQLTHDVNWSSISEDSEKFQIETLINNQLMLSAYFGIEINQDNVALDVLTLDTGHHVSPLTLEHRVRINWTTAYTGIDRPLCLTNDKQRFCLDDLQLSDQLNYSRISWENLSLHALTSILPNEIDIAASHHGEFEWSESETQQAHSQLKWDFIDVSLSMDDRPSTQLATNVSINMDMDSSADLRADIAVTQATGGQLNLRANKLSEEPDLNIEVELENLEIHALDLWLPMGSSIDGYINGTGNAKYSNEQFKIITANIDISDLSLFQNNEHLLLPSSLSINSDAKNIRLLGSFETILGAVRLNVSGDIGPDIKISGQLESRNNPLLNDIVESIDFQLNTSSLQLNLINNTGSLKFDGSLTSIDERLQWQIETADFQSKWDLGDWKTDQTWLLEVDRSKNSVSIGPHCWNRASSHWCINESMIFSDSHVEINLAWNDFNIPSPLLNPNSSIALNLNSTGNLRAKVIQNRLKSINSKIDVNGFVQIQDDPTKTPVMVTLEISKDEKEKVKGTINLASLGLADFTVSGTNLLQGEFDLLYIIIKELNIAPLIAYWTEDYFASGLLSANLSAARSGKNQLTMDGFLKLENAELMTPSLPLHMASKTIDATITNNKFTLSNESFINGSPSQIQIDAQWLPPKWKITGKITGDNIPVKDIEYDIMTHSDLVFTATEEGAELDGLIKVSSGKIIWKDRKYTRISLSEDVTLSQKSETPAKKSSHYPIKSNVNLLVEKPIQFEGYGLKTQLKGDLILKSTLSGITRLIGQIKLTKGQFRAYGTRLNITKGLLNFTGDTNIPVVDIEAERQSLQVVAGVKLTGPLDAPEVTLVSTPALSQAQILSYIIRGQPINGNALAEGIFLTRAALGNNRTESSVSKIGNKIGISDLTLNAEGDDQGSQISLTGYVTPKLFVRYGIGVLDSPSQLTMKYQLLPNLILQSIYGMYNSLDLLLSIKLNKQKYHTPFFEE